MRDDTLDPSHRASTQTTPTQGEELSPETIEAWSYDFNSGIDVLDKDGEQPSLGYLNEALEFIAAEHARFFTSHDAGGAVVGNCSSTLGSAFRAALLSQKRHRRKKMVKFYSQGPVNWTPLDSDSRMEDPVDSPSGTGHATLEDTSSSFESLPSPTKNATPITARGRSRKKGKTIEITTPPLLHSKSTPSLRLTATSLPLDPRVLKLRVLAHKYAYTRFYRSLDVADSPVYLTSYFPAPETHYDPDLCLATVPR